MPFGMVVPEPATSPLPAPATRAAVSAASPATSYPCRRGIPLPSPRQKLACDIVKRNGIGFVHFTGGEPLVHPDFTAMVAYAAQIGMITTLVTNGALLTQKRVDALAEAGLASVYISIDAASYKVHDSNRGLPGLSARIRRANAALKRHQIPSSASVTMSRVVDYPALPEALRDLGLVRSHFPTRCESSLPPISPAPSRRWSTSHPRSCMPLLRR